VNIQEQARLSALGLSVTHAHGGLVKLRLIKHPKRCSVFISENVIDDALRSSDPLQHLRSGIIGGERLLPENG